ncbi:glutamine--fructose-6-phosphate aminotransferase [Candidatus Falkowbacteria bacterium RBG_13_39_14]|uniref:Glutamine--fructose-6-phosphate aminotransferase [isomerizing] n=1 Tax=Candidatus Falkowbacteria bacterium RBG_13_39_14 TaxID=1797985 RepID=A0A1F5SAL9_9BACT|nr:MAG: glutamine--fructose-6-phosphate aminotransferase [Candidatus Falkowbacteria bacterium RBG_13_39_14]
MCGIIGYIGKNNALPILIDGLKRMEYRGYDSSGVAVCDKGDVFCVKAVGKIRELEEKVGNLSPTLPQYAGQVPSKGRESVGIAHTRWATHGRPTEANAHPHSDCTGNIWVVHNGIIENYKELKENLIKKGHVFKSETDSEVIAHLIEDIYKQAIARQNASKNSNLTYRNLNNSQEEGSDPFGGGQTPRMAHFNLLTATLKALNLLKGAYGLVVMHKDEPNKLIVAKLGSPLLIGFADNEAIIASDASAILRYTKQVIYLDDGEVAEINGGSFEIYDLESRKKNKEIEEIEWDITQAQKHGFAHFMLKEIFEQPEAIANSIRGRLLIEEGKAKLGGLDAELRRIRDIERIIIVSCGTAYHAGLIGEYMIEEYAGVPVEVEYASEFRYRKPILDDKTAILAISQSGETADTIAAIAEAKGKNVLTLGIVNTVGSTIARMTDAGVYNHSGPEIAVASTKAFTSQLAVLALFTMFLGRQRDMAFVTGERISKELAMLPEKIKKILELNEHIKNIAEKYRNAKNFAFLGRKYNYPVAIEGALKLKEISYIHSEGFCSGELKHGSIALIDEDFPSMFIAPTDSVYEKNLNNMAEIKARGGRIIAVATEGNEEIKSVADNIVYIPKTLEMLTPILSVIPLQLFAYHMAILNGRDVDKPRNLAKSVTVE